MNINEYFSKVLLKFLSKTDKDNEGNINFLNVSNETKLKHFKKVSVFVIKNRVYIRVLVNRCTFMTTVGISKITQYPIVDEKM